MSNYKNLVGKKFGQLMVIADVGRYSTGEVKWLCKCKCGNERTLKTSLLNAGGVKSCVKCNFTDYTGETIGLLYVICRSEDKIGCYGQKRIQWMCKCICGEIVYRLSDKLKRGNCCCEKCKSKQDKINNSKGHQLISGIFWNNIKRQAKLRGLKIELTIEQVWKLYESQNGRRKISGMNICFASSKREYLLGKTTASLDRKDSSLGYVAGNVQWVHKSINRMKSNHTDELFISMCCQVADYQRGK